MCPARRLIAEETEMTHKPPVPAGSQSPYPLHPAPARTLRPARPVRARPVQAQQEPAKAERSTGWTIGVGVAVIAVAFLFLRRR